MTKAAIIQRLLEEKQITVEEAMVLIAKESNPRYNPYSPPNKIGDMDYTGDPYMTWYPTSTDTYRED